MIDPEFDPGNMSNVPSELGSECGRTIEDRYRTIEAACEFMLDNLLETDKIYTTKTSRNSIRIDNEDDWHGCELIIDAIKSDHPDHQEPDLNLSLYDDELAEIAIIELATNKPPEYSRPELFDDSSDQENGNLIRATLYEIINSGPLQQEQQLVVDLFTGYALFLDGSIDTELWPQYLETMKGSIPAIQAFVDNNAEFTFQTLEATLFDKTTAKGVSIVSHQEFDATQHTPIDALTELSVQLCDANGTPQILYTREANHPSLQYPNHRPVKPDRLSYQALQLERILVEMTVDRVTRR